MDVHKDTIALGCLQGSSDSPVTFQIPNDPATIRRTITRLRAEGDLRTCTEAGPCGFALWRQLTQMEVACDVIAPSLIPRRPGDRVKTDRRDAVNLARLLRAGQLTAVRVPTEAEEAVRDRVRAREALRRDILISRHRLLKFLLRQGRIYRDGVPWTQKHRVWLDALEFPLPALRATFDHYRLSLQTRWDQRVDLDAGLLLIAQGPSYQRAVDRLRALRGIDSISALTIVAEVNDFRRFGTAAEFMGFIGIVPTEYSSGPSQQRGSITKTGNAHLRRVRVEAAWHYRHRPRLDGSLKQRQQGQPPAVRALAWKAQQRLYRRYHPLLARGKRSQVAAIAVARELAGFVWALMQESAA
jgi:transposase